MKTMRWTLAIVATGLLFCGCKGKEKSAEEAAPSQPGEATSSAPAASSEAPAPAKSEAPMAKSEPAPPPGSFDHELLHPSRLKDKAPDVYHVKFDTTRGVFTITVTRAWAPIGADRFYNLVKHHFYDDASIFRVSPGFVVQFGISAHPQVSAAWKHTDLKDDPVVQTNKRGYVTFATAGPDTRTTQVFINLRDNSRLDSMGFAPFGKVDGQGMNVVEMMYEGYGDADAPNQDQLEKLGNSYLKKDWPKLDYIKTASLVD
jgi:cyclophilin family peptidyl-prolyl cis-trans isomerase